MRVRCRTRSTRPGSESWPHAAGARHASRQEAEPERGGSGACEVEPRVFRDQAGHRARERATRIDLDRLPRANAASGDLGADDRKRVSCVIGECRVARELARFLEALGDPAKVSRHLRANAHALSIGKAEVVARRGQFPDEGVSLRTMSPDANAALASHWWRISRRGDGRWWRE